MTTSDCAGITFVTFDTVSFLSSFYCVTVEADRANIRIRSAFLTVHSDWTVFLLSFLAEFSSWAVSCSTAGRSVGCCPLTTRTTIFVFADGCSLASVASITLLCACSFLTLNSIVACSGICGCSSYAGWALLTGGAWLQEPETLFIVHHS